MSTCSRKFTIKIALFAALFTTICRAQTAPAPPQDGTFQPPVAPPFNTTNTFQSAVSPHQEQPSVSDSGALYSLQDSSEPSGSVYIPLDSWIYPAVLRLYGLGYMDQLFLGLRPYTRLSLLHALNSARTTITEGKNDEAEGIFDALLRYLEPEIVSGLSDRGALYGVDSVYVRALNITGLPLRDSYHLGSTLANDYGRPYQNGINGIAGFSTLAESGRLSLYVRGEYQHARAANGYSQAFAAQMMSLDREPFCNTSGSPLPCAYGPIPATTPLGPIAQLDNFHLVEANLSYHVFGQEISFGKGDSWLGPGMGGGMAWSNNAEDIYAFRVNRVEPLRIPGLSRFLGPMRYDFYVGSLKGHSYPRDPWVHAEKVSFHPTRDFEFGFERTVIWGGQGHEPINIKSFLHSMFSLNDSSDLRASNNDPGARYASFDMSYRIPGLRNWLTFYTDSTCHNDVSPISAPRRAAYRPGLYLSHVPGLPKFDLRAEAVSTNPSVRPDYVGTFYYWDSIQTDGYTNKGNIMGDWIGREAKGGQAWLTWHFSGDQFFQVAYLRKKIPTSFIPGGTTQNQFRTEALFNLRHHLQIDVWAQFEGWKAPIYQSGLQQDTTAALQVTWHPGLH